MRKRNLKYFANFKKEIRKTLGGTRTRNLWIRSPKPYPFGHESFIIIYKAPKV